MNQLSYKYLFLFVVGFYCLVLAHFGFETFDSGYMPSFAWRIVNGFAPYKDFIYKFPPATIYLLAGLMKITPDLGQFYFFKVIFYLQFAGQVYFFVSAADAIYHLQKHKVNLWGLMLVCYVVSLHNFMVAPWNTTDGLFFASIAFWLLYCFESKVVLRLFLIAFFAFLAALTKQSFYPIPLLLLVAVFVQYKLKFTAFYLGFLLALGTVFYAFLSYNDLISNFLNYTTGETDLQKLYHSGVFNYVMIPIKYLVFIIPAMVTIVLIYLYFFKKSLISLVLILKYSAYFLCSIGVVVYFLFDLKLGSRLFFDASILFVFYLFFSKLLPLHSLIPVLVLLGFAWCSSISLGSGFPILFFTGILISLVVLGFFRFLDSKYYLYVSIPFVITAFGYNYYPYREATIFDLKYDMGSVSPKLKYIYTSKQNLAKHLELQALQQQYPKPNMVLPDMPGVNYLLNTQSSLPADWVINTEINRQYDLFISLATAKGNTVFLEKSFLEQTIFEGENDADFSMVARYIFNHYRPSSETIYFKIYTFD